MAHDTCTKEIFLKYHKRDRMDKGKLPPVWIIRRGKEYTLWFLLLNNFKYSFYIQAEVWFPRN